VISRHPPPRQWHFTIAKGWQDCQPVAQSAVSKAKAHAGRIRGSVSPGDDQWRNGPSGLVGILGAPKRCWSIGGQARYATNLMRRLGCTPTRAHVIGSMKRPAIAIALGLELRIWVVADLTFI